MIVPILLLFFLSGACGLVYEVVWVRMLTRVFGTTTFAVSALLASFMGGLCLGSWLSGRLLARRGRALILFGLCELGVGAYALTLPWLMPVAERSFLGAAGDAGLGPLGERMLKLLLSAVLLVPPATLMGATLPLLAQHTVERFTHLASRTGLLYAVNTFGAVVGCALAGFVAIPSLGIRGTTRAAAAVNFAVGLTAVIAAGLERKQVGSSAFLGEEVPAGSVLYPARAVRWATAAFAVSGLAALGLEIVWTRLVAVVFTGYTYSFTVVLTVFLLGIGAGSLAVGPVADRSRDPLRLLGLIQIGIGLSALALAPLFSRAQGWARALAPDLGGGWGGETAAKVAVSAALLLPPTVLFGAGFPVATRVAARNVRGLGAVIGALYAANVAGGIGGSFLTGYALIPIFGSHQSLRILCGLVLLLGVGLVLVSPASPERRRTAAALLGAAGAVIGLLAWPADVSREIHKSWLVRNEILAFYEEGVEATVMVGESPGPAGTVAKRILVTGSSASNSTHYGLSVNRIQGSIPFLFERAPRKVLAICFGTGITFGTLAEFQPDRVDGVEISREVLEAAGLFAEFNYDATRNPRLHLHVDDGRNFLLKSRERYDAITMEPMPPALAGVVDFYTRDFYGLCRAHLEPGGVLSQWVPLYFLGPGDVRMLYRTFAEAFPHALVFGYKFDTFLVGSDRPLDLSGRRFVERLLSARLEHDLAALGLSRPEQMLRTFLMGREAMLRFASGSPVVTDDLPYIEFTAPRSAGLDHALENLVSLVALAEPASLYLKPGEPEADRLRAALDEAFRARRAALGRAAETP